MGRRKRDRKRRLTYLHLMNQAAIKAIQAGYKPVHIWSDFFGMVVVEATKEDRAEILRFPPPVMAI